MPALAKKVEARGMQETKTVKLGYSSTHGPTDEATLVRQAQAGNMPAFEMLYREHVAHANAICLRMTRDPAKAEECVQEAFVRAWSNIGNFAGASTFRTWLHRIAVNEVLGLQRREQRQGAQLRLVAEQARLEQHGASGRDATAEQIDLDEAIGELPDGARNVFVLSGINGYTHEQTAQMLGIAVGTSKAQLHRARALLAQRLDR